MEKNKFEQTSFLFGSNSAFIEELYQLYQSNPNAVDKAWQDFFKSYNDPSAKSLKSTAKIILPIDKKVQTANAPSSQTNSEIENSLKAKFMIADYRARGHYLAKLDPLGLELQKSAQELKLELEDFGFSQNDLDITINIAGEFNGLENCTLNELMKLLNKTYCNSLGVEFSHVENFEEQKWLFDSIEDKNAHSLLLLDEKKAALKDLCEIEGFEQYLHMKFPGAKRFSIEGGDAAIASLSKFIEISGNQGVSDTVIGMAHRGRLCTLTKVMGKPYRALLAEFGGASAFPGDLDVSGDVKYHMGYSSDKVTAKGNKIHLSLTPNPSHLEAVNPVVAGKVRAKQDLIKDLERKKVMGILIHGDAAFCGQGVVAENLIMSGLEAYNVGGIFHLVINNQIGFTANAKDTRPGRYATEIAKIVGAPILHVNGEDIEAVLLATNIAAGYRNKFGKDIVIDILCYRKYGHNEGDEPMYTQSVMYNIIKNKQTPGSLYANKLVTAGLIDSSYFTKLKEEFKSFLDKEFAETKNYKPHAQWLEGMWAGFARSVTQNSPTGVAKDLLKKLAKELCKVPKDFVLNSKLEKLFDDRILTLNQDKLIDWATAEQLAFATILNDKIPIRLTGQDCERGTFSHRHSVLHNQLDDTTYIPLNNLSEDQANYFVADSNLSEYAVLGFEYGYSQVNPKHLVIWEAQFGDFANGAQIIFDQFISSSETKWLRMSGLVMLLPHAFEGQGPEHSSARLERFLQLCAEDNIQVAYPTTPASIFHLLRRQVYRDIRKPLIVMSPKSLLRHKFAVSALDDLKEGTSFQPILDEIDTNLKLKDITKVIFCSGKIYYDILEARIKNKITNTVIIRFEQLYPYIEDLSIELLTKYKNVKEFIWMQEEPKNMGAWSFIKPYLNESLLKAKINNKFKYVGRKAAASPAVGYLYVHNKQQEKIIKEGLSIE